MSIHYDRKRIISAYLVLSFINLFSIFPVSDATYFVFMREFPGSIVTLSVILMIGSALVVFLPTFVRALTDRPAVTFLPEGIVFYGWRQVCIPSDEYASLQVLKQGDLVKVRWASAKKRDVDLRHLRERDAFVEILEGLSRKSRESHAHGSIGL